MPTPPDIINSMNAHAPLTIRKPNGEIWVTHALSASQITKRIKERSAEVSERRREYLIQQGITPRF